METFKTIRFIIILTVVFALIGVFAIALPSLIVGIDYQSTREVSGTIIAISSPELQNNKVVVKIFWETPEQRIMSGGYIWEPYELTRSNQWTAIYNAADRNIPIEWLGAYVNKKVRMMYFVDSLDYRVYPVGIEILK